ncbi:fungal-specific transcription factor domain-containing protein [Microdochium trichocladiopsis]|uniref:Fungal-specific transcription factor domain-containing protein n=1 Tax=Microdochium trichocladiopsis TaxID=1682393 RepID=A0A9P9BRQ8_9PEZI|nr:fungal-specific transcription factor domain-containing protein [Microdochium trichocladiopsis]KAH7033191.1 fungal-specific transcription factor domain-containing protein [Microdochium trichocladiopsis]
MTTVSPPQAIPANKDLQAARKRRRRAPAGGAADDCFACVKTGAKCDRRRPYCSQCLEFGNECSGYKTQLTWGVGVASRGKLRGLSLPIAKAPPVQPVPKKASMRARASSNATSQWSNDSGDRSPKSIRRDSVEVRTSHLSASVPTTPYQQFGEYPRFPLPTEHAPVSTQAQWASLPAFTDHYNPEPPRFHKINTAMSHFSMMGEPMSASVESLSDVEYTMSPMAHTFPSREEQHFMSSPTIIYEGYATHSSPPPPHSPASAIMINNQRSAAPSCPSLVYAPSEHGSSLSSHHDAAFDAHMAHRLMADNDTLSVPELDSYSTSPHSSVSGYWPPSSMREETKPLRPLEHMQAHSALPLETSNLQVSPDLIAKIPFFLDYYEKTMCPSMVLIDGPTNPYRNHILQLASSSRSLQHAICALAACNLRMKRRLSLGQHSREFSLAEIGNGDLAAGDDPSLSEELQHRNLAIALLNEQLNDPAKASHDSVLATILLLCHYRMVESGIAKFHTQFAGVKKILSMRGHGSSSSAWMEAVFTYFDSISASINDREAQLSHGFFGLSLDAPLIPAGAENWVGCDHELFKTIGKLGRLNLLSQHRPVQSPMDFAGLRSTSPIGSPLGQSFKAPVGDFFSIPTGRFDGNGFSTQLNSEQMLSSSVGSSPDYDDLRSNFWREWKEARTALQSWEFDAQRVAASLPEPATPSTLRDLGHLSEAFRYAALLYTERLASPHVPSSHNTFRNLVSQVVYYATSLEAGSSAEKFLLWPMFVAGSECVNELQQNIVRNKCRDIMARSGYMNNLSAIEVLERLWAGEFLRPSEMAPGAHIGPTRGPFSWTRCLGGRGPDVEWIMF